MPHWEPMTRVRLWRSKSEAGGGRCGPWSACFCSHSTPWEHSLTLPASLSVILQTHGHDKYGRTLAEVLLPDGMNLNQELVKRGWCWMRREIRYLKGGRRMHERGRKGCWNGLGLLVIFVPIPLALPLGHDHVSLEFESD